MRGRPGPGAPYQSWFEKEPRLPQALDAVPQKTKVHTPDSLDAYFAGQPRSYTRRIGDPRIRYETVQAAVYVQDDIKVQKTQ